MKPFYFKIENDLKVMVIPDADAHMDGHPTLTYSYAIYMVAPGEDKKQTNTDALLTPERIKNPNYLGTIYFDQPYKAFTYTSDGMNELSGAEVKEIIDKITHYRTNPTLWRI
jgi:hypothetical protein